MADTSNPAIQAFLQANGLATSAFTPDSRYYSVATAQLTQPDGSIVAYVKRRFVPAPASFALLQEHVVVAGDRLDNLAARYLGDPLQYWRLCDANGARRPDELTAVPGQRLRITLPAGVPGANGRLGDDLEPELGSGAGNGNTDSGGGSGS
jgi:nucleoid-associated protein YgaU